MWGGLLLFLLTPIKMAYTHAVSCDKHIEKLIKEMNISPSEAFRIGVRAMAREEVSDDPNVSYAETEKSRLAKLQRANTTLQDHITKMEDEMNGKK